MISAQRIREALFATLVTMIFIYAIFLSATDDEPERSMQQAWDARYAANSEVTK